MGTWNAYGNEYWPADYLIDAHGQVRYATFGEGDYDKTETAIRALLAEAGHAGRRQEPPDGVVVPSEEATPETYLGTARAQGWVNGPKAGLHDYGAAAGAALPLNEFAYSGTWKIAGQPARPVAGAGIDLEFQAKNVYLVLSSPGERPLPVQVLLDGHPISAADAGADVHDGIVTVAASACTRSSRCRATNSTASACASRPASPATRSRSASAGAAADASSVEAADASAAP